MSEPTYFLHCIKPDVIEQIKKQSFHRTIHSAKNNYFLCPYNDCDVYHDSYIKYDIFRHEPKKYYKNKYHICPFNICNKYKSYHICAYNNYELPDAINKRYFVGNFCAAIEILKFKSLIYDILSVHIDIDCLNIIKSYLGKICFFNCYFCNRHILYYYYNIYKYGYFKRYSYELICEDCFLFNKESDVYKVKFILY